MGRDRVLDPVKRDYLHDGRGGRVTTMTAMTKCQHQILTALNTWCGDYLAGALYNQLERKDTDEEITAAADYTRRALQRVVDWGDIRDVEVETGFDQAGRRAVVWSAIDVISGERLNGIQTLPYGA